jgi:hypothetical protein
MTSENWRGENKRRKQSHNGSRRSYGGQQRKDDGNFAVRGVCKKLGKDNEKTSNNTGARPKSIPVKLRTDPIPTMLCPYCGLPIKDLSAAFSGADGAAVHFECVQKHIAAAEADSIAKGDAVIYIGGGRFGIVYFERPSRAFKIKKIIEWEQKDNHAPWRGHIADHFSLT